MGVTVQDVKGRCFLVSSPFTSLDFHRSLSCFYSSIVAPCLSITFSTSTHFTNLIDMSPTFQYLLFFLFSCIYCVALALLRNECSLWERRRPLNLTLERQYGCVMTTVRDEWFLDFCKLQRWQWKNAFSSEYWWRWKNLGRITNVPLTAVAWLHFTIM